MYSDNDIDATNNRNRLAQIKERWRQHPGSRQGGTGETGLNKNDGQGWSRMQNDNIWAMEQERGGEPFQVRQVQTPNAPPSFAELYQQAPEFFHSKNAKTGGYQYQPRSLYEHNALGQLRGLKYRG